MQNLGASPAKSTRIGVDAKHSMFVRFWRPPDDATMLCVRSVGPFGRTYSVGPFGRGHSVLLNKKKGVNTYVFSLLLYTRYNISKLFNSGCMAVCSVSTTNQYCCTRSSSGKLYSVRFAPMFQCPFGTGSRHALKTLRFGRVDRRGWCCYWC